VQLVYGGVQIGDTSWVRLTWGRELLLNAAGYGYAHRGFCSASQIGFRCAGQADARARMLVVENALVAQGNDLLFLNDDGSPSANSVLAAACLVPPRCVRGPVWSDKPGAQFLTWREYAADFEWEVPASPGPLLLDFRESVTVSGGTPLRVVQEYLNAPPDAVTTVYQQKVVVTQQGFALGVDSYPPAAAPLFPNPNANPVTNTSPDRVGRGYRSYRTDWAYAWEFADPFLAAGAAPLLWVE
jgi:hypothetical protein